jgi:hypothetical protein
MGRLLSITIALTQHHFKECLGELTEKRYLGSRLKLLYLISPAVGAMFAPLASKLVQGGSSIFDVLN